MKMESFLLLSTWSSEQNVIIRMVQGLHVFAWSDRQQKHKQKRRRIKKQPASSSNNKWPRDENETDETDKYNGKQLFMEFRFTVFIKSNGLCMNNCEIML